MVMSGRERASAVFHLDVIVNVLCKRSLLTPSITRGQHPLQHLVAESREVFSLAASAQFECLAQNLRAKRGQEEARGEQRLDCLLEGLQHLLRLH